MDKFLKKTTARTKERLLEGIGQAKKTQDEVFDQHAANLTKQAKSSERLQKDIKGYCVALRTLCQAERQLRDTIREIYEIEWPEKEQLSALLDNLDIQTNEIERSMGEDLIQTVSQYVGQFGDLKKKVEKRGRKLIDYDHAKNTYNSLKSSSKKVDSDPKVAKALTDFQEAEGCYKEINGELIEILPAIYDSRITFIVDTLQTMFNAQSVYNTECSKMNKQVVSQLDKLGQSFEALRVPRVEPRTLTPIDTVSNQEESSRVSTPSPDNSVSTTPARNSVVSANINTTPAVQKTPAANPFDDEDHTPAEEEEEVCQNRVYPKLNAAPPKDEKKEEEKKESANPFDDSDDESAAPKEVEGNTTEKIGDDKILYIVVTTHEYKAVDSDELSFGPNEEIKVLESNSSDLDDGWKLGIKADGTKGVFPENFTKKK